MPAISAVPTHPIALAPGDTMPTDEIGPLTRTDFVRYAGAGGDLNPIHHDEPMATGAGMPSVFGMGMLHAGVLGNRLARWVGPESILSFGVRFTGQVWPGDTLTFIGSVKSIDDDVADIVLQVARRDGSVVMTGTARAQIST